MAKLDTGAIMEYNQAFNSLLGQIDAIKTQFIQISNQIRNKDKLGIRLPVSEYKDFMNHNSNQDPQFIVARKKPTLSLSASLTQ